MNRCFFFLCVSFLHNQVKASKAIVDRSNVIFSESKTHLVNETAAAWNEIAEEMQAYFGSLGDTPWTGKQLRDKILSFPLGMPLVFLRINEQLGLEVNMSIFPKVFCVEKQVSKSGEIAFNRWLTQLSPSFNRWKLKSRIKANDQAPFPVRLICLLA
jgi:hypothetical protein